jgi:signal transduction histidine kinase
MAVVDNKPRSASVITETRTEVFFIRRQCLVDIMNRSPRLSINLMRLFSLRMRDFNRQYIDEVLQAERLALVGRFARSIVHDIKNPLNIIGLAAELVGGESATLEMRHIAKWRIQKQVERLGNMVNELLEFTRGEQRESILQLVPFSNFLLQLLEDVHEELRSRGVKLAFENQPPDTEVRIDPPRLSHLFYNLWNNAADAMEPFGGSISMRFREERGRLVTEVEDTGPGIPPEIADTLFEAFATFGKRKGTGLGLSICRKIMNDHKGNIEAVNEPGRGAVFRLWLPVPSESKAH